MAMGFGVAGIAGGSTAAAIQAACAGRTNRVGGWVSR